MNNTKVAASVETGCSQATRMLDKPRLALSLISSSLMDEIDSSIPTAAILQVYKQNSASRRARHGPASHNRAVIA